MLRIMGNNIAGVYMGYISIAMRRPPGKALVFAEIFLNGVDRGPPSIVFWLTFLELAKRGASLHTRWPSAGPPPITHVRVY